MARRKRGWEDVKHEGLQTAASTGKEVNIKVVGIDCCYHDPDERCEDDQSYLMALPDGTIRRDREHTRDV